MRSSLKILITRPENKGLQLAAKINKLGMTSTCQVFFDYKKNTNKQQIQQLFTNKPQAMVIFVSIAAVNFANDAWPIEHWPCKVIIAVGLATQQALQQLVTKKVYCPEHHHSEGLLTLALLQNISDNDIIIVRGDGGREFLTQQLSMRGANVFYLESYQRLWRTFDKNIVKQWHAEQINCIVITSNALLECLIQLIDQFDNIDTSSNIINWKNSILWIVASKRIADNAKSLGLKQVINAQGANDLALLTALQAVAR